MKAPNSYQWIGFILLLALSMGGCGGSSDDDPALPGSSVKAITAFSFTMAANPQLAMSVTGVIDEANAAIALVGPLDPEDVASLKATFTTTGASLSVAGVTQTSGVTANSFAVPLTYRVTAEDGSTRDYTVYVAHWRNPSGLADHISPGGKEVYAAPQIAMNSSGDAVIVWLQRDATNTLQIYMSEYRGGAWTHPDGPDDSISPSGGQGAYYPKVAMDSDGNTIIAWSQNDGGDEGGDARIYKSEYRGGLWTHPADLSDYISPEDLAVSDPKVAMDDNGNAIIVWTSWNSGDNRIYMSEYRDETWDHPANSADYVGTPPNNIFDLRIAMDNDGNAVMVWRQWKTGDNNFQIYKSEYRNSAWTHPASLNDNISPNGKSAYLPQVAMDDNGNALIVWYQSDSTNINQIFMSEYRDGDWAHPASLSDNISPDGQNAFTPMVAMNSNGNALIAWHQNNQMYKSEYWDGVWIHPAGLSDNISPDGALGLDNPPPHAVAMDDGGNAIIGWLQLDGDDDPQIFLSEYRLWES